MPQTHPVPVLFVHHRPELGGAPSSLSHLIRALDRGRYEPHVYCPPGAAADLFRDAGATVHTGPVAGFTHIWASNYRGLRWLLLVRELSRLPAHARSFRRTLRHTGFALVHLNDSPLVPAALLARRARVPVVWHLRSTLPGDGTDRRSRFLRRTIGRLAAATIAINEDVADAFGLDSAVVPNSVDLARFQPGDRGEARRAAGLDADRPVVSFFGFIYPSKGVREVIEAAWRVRAGGLDATWLIVGGGVRRADFFASPLGRALQLAGLVRDHESDARELVARLDLRDVVRFVPFTRETAVLYRASDLVVAPSRGPELGRPVLEAAASGIPVVAPASRTAGGGVAVPDETAVLVADLDGERLAEAVAALLRDPERSERLGRAARAFAEQHFDRTRNARAVEAIYDRVIRGRTGEAPAGGSARPLVARRLS